MVCITLPCVPHARVQVFSHEPLCVGQKPDVAAKLAGLLARETERRLAESLQESLSCYPPTTATSDEQQYARFSSFYYLILSMNFHALCPGMRNKMKRIYTKGIGTYLEATGPASEAGRGQLFLDLMCAPFAKA